MVLWFAFLIVAVDLPDFVGVLFVCVVFGLLVLGYCWFRLW